MGERFVVVLCRSQLTVRGACSFFFQAEDGIRDLVRARGLGDVYKRQDPIATWHKLMQARDVKGLDAWLADDVVFHSPVVHLSLIHI